MLHNRALLQLQQMGVKSQIRHHYGFIAPFSKQGHSCKIVQFTAPLIQDESILDESYSSLIIIYNLSCPISVCYS